MATAIALGGVVVLTASDLSLNPVYFAGDLISFGSMLFYAFYMARTEESVLPDRMALPGSVVQYGSRGVYEALFFVNPIQPYDAREVALILGLGIKTGHRAFAFETVRCACFVVRSSAS